MNCIHFVKVQATGNDFILIDARGAEQNWSELAKLMCHRHFGVGADGLILILSSGVADFGMHVFNPDGSEAEACGNGLRCFTKYVVESKLSTRHRFEVETIAGIRAVQAEVKEGRVIRVQVAMDVPRFTPEEIPVLMENLEGEGWEGDLPLKSKLVRESFNVGGKNLTISCVSMGNPHAVSFLREPVSSFPLSEVGPMVECYPIFPNRTNFEIANISNRHQIIARVWERGVGETLSCGSGACAIAVAARLHNLIGSQVDIILPGGTLNVEWEGRGEVLLSGPVDSVFRGEWPDRSGFEKESSLCD